MKLVTSNETGLIHYALADDARAILTATYLAVENGEDASLNASNARIVPSVSLPDNFKLGCFSYTDSEGFTLVAHGGDASLAAQMVNAERTRRLNVGAAFTVPGAVGVHLQGRSEDKSVYLGQLVRAQGLKAAGVTDPVVKLRDANDVIWMLTPDQALGVISLGMTWFEAVMQVSWDMKDGGGDFTGGIPADFEDDGYWP